MLPLTSLHLYRRQTGLVVVRCEYVLPSKLKVRQLSPDYMVSQKGPADWLLYRGALGGVANPLGSLTWPKILASTLCMLSI